MPQLAQSLGRHVAIAAATGAAIGCVDGLVLSAIAGELDAIAVVCVVVIAFGVMAPLTALFGLPQWALWNLLALYTRQSSWRDLWQKANDRTSEDREPVIRFHALVVLFFAVGASLGAAVWIAIPTLERVQDESQRRLITTVFATAALVGFGLASALLWPLVRRGCEHLDTRRRLPLPARGWLRFLLFVFLPVGGGTFGLLYGYDGFDALGPALLPLALLAFITSEGLLALVLWEDRPLERARKLAAIAFTGLAAACAVSAPLLLDRSRDAVSTAERGRAIAMAVQLARRLADVDGDGVAGTYGGRDCAPLSGEIAPGRPDKPANGIDEDCDGADGTGQPAARPVFSGKWDEDRARPFNVMWLVADAFRPDHMQIYGAERKTTPYLSAHGKKFIKFREAYVQATTTHLSIPSMLVGKEASALNWRYGRDKTRVELAEGETTLAERLRGRGYYTAAVVGSHMHRLGAFLAGFDVVRRVSPRWGSPLSLVRAMELLHTASQQPKPFFLLAYFEDAHKPYRRHHLGEPVFGRRAIDRYDGEIAFVDRHLGILLQQLRFDKEARNNTIIIITSDHGEEFGEHGGLNHGRHCHRETMQVPLLVFIPGLEGRWVDTPVALIDVVPTILELIGAPTGESLTGQSLLVPILSSHEVDGGRPIYCVALNQGRTRRRYFQLAVRRGNRVLIHDRVHGTYTLFDTANDPQEQRDISELPEERAMMSQMRELLTGADDGGAGNLWQLSLR